MSGSLSGSSPRSRECSQLLWDRRYRPGGVVELQIAAAGVVERLDRLLVGLGEIVEEGVDVRIDRLADLPALAEMHHAGAGMVIFGVTLVCAFRNLK